MQDSTTVVETHDLTKQYDRGGEGVLALDAVNLRVQRGELVAVMGPSGSGKSTLLNLIGTLDRPTSGKVCVNGCDLSTVRNLDAFRAHDVGFVFQLHNLIPTLTAGENVAIAMQSRSLARRQQQDRVQELLGLVGLTHRASALPAQLSGGERQRVAIARALANAPALLLADEPTGNLDSESGREVVELFGRLNKEKGVTIMIVTHNPIVALACHRIVTLRDGQVELDEVVDASYQADVERIRSTPVGQLLLGTRFSPASLPSAN